MLVGRIGLNELQSKRVQANHNEAKGLSPEFFGPPGPKDKMMDMQMCQQLGIDPAGMDRSQIKANILSGLTGKPVDQMQAFYSSVGEQDMRKDLQEMRRMGMEPSHQPNMMKARAENKAMIVNGWMQDNNIQEVDQESEAQNTSKIDGTKGAKGAGQGGRPGDPTINALLDQYGLSNTGSIEGDLAALYKAIAASAGDDQDVNQLFQSLTGYSAPSGAQNDKQKNGPEKGDQAILSLMQQYGIRPTGDKNADMQTLMKVMAQDNLTSGAINSPNNSQQPGDRPPPKTPEAVAAFMQSLGLQPTNSKEGDFAAINSKLNSMISSAGNDSERSNAQNLRTQFAAVIASV
ncbi:MAG: hypothetical protein AB1782_16480 [Cyanobacteriota bacterium]